MNMLYFDGNASEVTRLMPPPAVAGSGEANTASNLGGGIGIFDSKLAVDLQFRPVASVSGGITIALNGSVIEWTLVPGAIDHDALLNFVAAEHIDWTGVAAGTIDVSNLPVASIDHDSLLNFLAAEHIDWTGVAAGTIDVSNLPVASIDHDSLLNFVAAEHIDWSSPGAGTIAANNLPNAHGSLEVESNATTTTFAGSSSDFSNASQITVFDTNGPSNNATPDHTNDHITVGANGDYEMVAAVSFSGGTSDTYSLAFFKNNGATQLGARTTRKLGTGGDIGSAVVAAQATLTAGDTVELWMQNETDTSAATVQDCAMTLNRVA